MYSHELVYFFVVLTNVFLILHLSEIYLKKQKYLFFKSIHTLTQTHIF